MLLFFIVFFVGGVQFLLFMGNRFYCFLLFVFVHA